MKKPTQREQMAYSTIARLEAEVERLQRFETAYKEFSDKTDWVQESAHWSELGMHRADVLRKRCNDLTSHNQAQADEIVRLRKDASLHENLQRAAGELPGAWSIDVSVERHAGWVSLSDGEGNEVELSGEGHLSERVSEALEVALEMAQEQQP